MQFGTVLRNVDARKSPIGYWINIHIGPDRKVFHRKMCHQMHRPQIFYALICQLIRPCHHIIGYVIHRIYSALCFVLRFLFVIDFHKAKTLERSNIVWLKNVTLFIYIGDVANHTYNMPYSHHSSMKTGNHENQIKLVASTIPKRNRHAKYKLC